MASSAFARHYSRNHNCFLFLRVLRCFTSPRSLQLPYIFRQRLPDMTPVFQGFPIRTSSDQSSFTNSPRLIAGYNVLLRLLVPRHPPIALSSLLIYKDARVHCEVLKIRARPTNQHPQQASTNRFTQKSRRTMRPTLQNPTECSGKDPLTKLSTPPKKKAVLTGNGITPLTHQCSTIRCLPGRRQTLRNQTKMDRTHKVPCHGSLERR